MALGILVLITALTISAVAIYYSIAGLVAIFAAAAIPIIVMGTALEIGKLVTAVWLHKYWQQAKWWLKTYLTTAVVILMFITSMGIFGFLSKAHIEQTSASEESVAQVTQLDTEIGRLNAVIDRSEVKIKQLETSGTGADANLQAQIDKEQERIDLAFKRIQPAIDQQNKIIADARSGDAERTKPYEDQLTSIKEELKRLETSARNYEESIKTLSADSSSTNPLLAQIENIQQTIVKVEGQIASGEREQIKQAQTTIGSVADGSVGPRTRAAANAWIEKQKEVINGIQKEISRLRDESKETVNAERERLASIVKDIRQVQIPALKDRELTMLAKIDEVRATESPVIATARDEIQRLRKSAEEQVKASQKLIDRLRSQLAQSDKTDEIDKAVDEQLARIKTAEAEIDILTEEKYKVEAEYRKLEAEVGPIKYIAEFVYGEKADKNLLEEAVRWVILIIIFVFDPLAVLLLIASQYTFEFARDRKKQSDWHEYETKRAAMIAANQGPDNGTVDESTDDDIQSDDVEHDERDGKTDDEDGVHEREAMEKDEGQVSDSAEEEKPQISEYEKSINVEDDDTSNGMLFGEDNLKKNEIKDRAKLVKEWANDEDWTEARNIWQKINPDDDPNDYRQAYISGRIHNLPWEVYLPDQKKSIESLDESAQQRADEIEYLDSLDNWRDAKQMWKEANPHENLKTYKKAYIKGFIDKLPWEEYLPEERTEGYVQNEEQNDDSIWKRISDKPNNTT